MSETKTRERILDVAEKLFADNGFDGTSLRAITAAADVNLAAVHYHFGSKSGLLQATVRRRIEPVNAERLRRIDAAIAAADGGTPSVEEIVGAFVRPAIEAFADVDPHEMAAMISIVHSRDIDDDFFRDTFAELMQRFMILVDAVPHLSHDEMLWRLHFTVGAMIQAFNPRVCTMHADLRSWDRDAIADAIVTFVSAGFRAPSSRAAEATGAPERQDTSSGHTTGQEQSR